MKNIKVWRTKGMTDIPKMYRYFRVGPHAGWCAFRTPWFVVMVIPKGWEYEG